ncbi:MAG: cation transporter [Candidatus Omnitrophica bacterium]|nr:cation transporter [Candidatus Omnitrophota bacterium]
MTTALPRADAHRRNVGAVVLSLTVATLLLLVKAVVGLLTHSMGILASAVDSALDVTASAINLVSIVVAAKPADANHPYGHGKAENLAGLFQSLVITASGLWLVLEALRRWIMGFTLDHVTLGLWVMVVSAILSGWLTVRLKSVAGQTHSIVVGTEQTHYATDFATNLGVVATLWLVQRTGSSVWDLLISVVIAGWILWLCRAIFLRAVNELMDRDLPPEERSRIEQVILGHHPQIVSFHNLRTRRVGQQRFIDCHIEIRGEESFQRAHDLTESLIAELRREFEPVDVTVHADPEGGI